ncbi:MAG: YlbF family regulator [Clostridiales bacterium]|nr:YlbF family regulator [Clostridiales bacterium]
MTLQMAAAAHTQLPQEEVQRFSQLSSLLFAGSETSAFLMAELRLQQAMADVFRIITEASGLTIDLPGGQ